MSDDTARRQVVNVQMAAFLRPSDVVSDEGGTHNSWRENGYVIAVFE